ncbi:P-II family nitrogen regulator [Accumulibacter sp.]|uniref:P-II family nitrogen regulator n=1 Tax=Accumulibacter sp. TaxID=2053492 RepID=UPI0025F0FF84|nr:transcriptional regulator [Accumulibacter sp.]MCM8596980.1 transcriptional regulator [Accumulibacter sp.]MCM8624474.1 transcriptional regulator [Accumulibacter sp.]MDS4051129.1 transcriptional regulator [Accumulibacter sp.]
MQTHPCRLLVILAEAALESRLVEDALRLGAHGYTIVDARGGGSSGAREALWDADRCIRMEVLCDAHTCEVLGEHLQQSYFAHYSICLYVCEVGVLRPEKYRA